MKAMKLSTLNRPDGIPVIQLEAENTTDRQRLSTLLEELGFAHAKALAHHKAGEGATCGEHSDAEGVVVLRVPVLLGSPPDGLVNKLWLPPQPDAS